MRILISAILFLVLAKPVNAEIEKSAVRSISENLPGDEPAPSALILDIGGRNAIFPVPEASVSISKQSPEMFGILQKFVPPGSVLLDALAKSSEMERLATGESETLDNYFFITEMTVNRKKDFDKKMYDDLVVFLEKQGKQLVENEAGDMIKAHTKKASEELSKQYDQKVDVRISDIGFLGVYKKTPEIFIFSARSKVSDGPDGAQDTVVSSAASIYLGGKIIMLVAYGVEKPQEELHSTLTWTRTEIDKWSQAVMQANSSSTKAE